MRNRRRGRRPRFQFFQRNCPDRKCCLLHWSIHKLKQLPSRPMLNSTSPWGAAAPNPSSDPKSPTCGPRIRDSAGPREWALAGRFLRRRIVFDIGSCDVRRRFASAGGHPLVPTCMSRSGPLHKGLALAAKVERRAFPIQWNRAKMSSKRVKVPKGKKQGPR